MNAGRVVLTYKVDNGGEITVTNVADTVPQNYGNPNKVLLDIGKMEAGNHTLRVTYVSGAPWKFDFLVYEPSFSSFAQIPVPSNTGQFHGVFAPTHGTS